MNSVATDPHKIRPGRKPLHPSLDLAGRRAVYEAIVSAEPGGISTTTLCKAFGCFNRPSVIRRLDELAEAGLIEPVRLPGKVRPGYTVAGYRLAGEDS